MKSYFCNSPGLAVRIIPSDMNMVWSAPVPNDANAPEKEGSVSCNLWRKTLIPIVEQKDETDSKHVRISDLAGLEKQLHVSETCISAEIYCVQWRIFLDTIHLHHFASNFRRIHTHHHRPGYGGLLRRRRVWWGSQMHGLWHEPGQEMIDLCLMTVLSGYRRYLWKSSRVVDYIIDILTNWHPLACCLCSAWQEPITYFEQEIERYIAAHKRLLEHLGLSKGWFGFLLTFLEHFGTRCNTSYVHSKSTETSQ